MPVVSASIPELEYSKMREMGISPSKAIQMGLAMIFKYGGTDKVVILFKETEKIKRDYGDLLEINTEQKRTIARLKENLNDVRKEWIKETKKNKNDSGEKINREDPADRLMKEIKEEEGK